MVDPITELFLTEYFLFERMGGKLISDNRELFDRLAPAFFIKSKRERDELYALTEREEVKGIASYADFAQLCRINKYAHVADGTLGLGEDIDIVMIKGNALRRSGAAGMEEARETTKTAISKRLADNAYSGAVEALCMVGFLRSEGLFWDKDLKHGLVNLERAARWNSVEGALLALRYNKDNRQKNANRLASVVHNRPYERAIELAQKEYKITKTERLPENRLLTKAFGADILKADSYSAQHARFIFSEVLENKDKERILFSGSKEMIAEAADLPLKLKRCELKVDQAAFDELPLKRPEHGVIIHALTDDFRPLCICSDSEYLRELYMDAAKKAIAGARVKIIDARDLRESDFAPTKNHVFVREADEDATNVYFLLTLGNVSHGVMSEIENFLQCEKRARLRLSHPSVDLDLSAVVPVCFCDKANVAQLKDRCEVITISPVSDEEKLALIQDMLSKKAEQYGVTKITADEGAITLLSGYSLDRAVKVIDRAVRLNRGKVALTVDGQMIEQAAASESERSVYGFGG